MNPVPESKPAAGGSEWIVEANARTFETEVLGRSLEVPVLLDFWATWCGPCKTLGPELERRAREGKGRFLLAKVDIDRNPELAQAFRVQAVPTVLAIVGGRLVDGFQGALAPAEIDAFLTRIAPQGSTASRADLLLEHARALVEDGDLEGAITQLRDLLRTDPEHKDARLFLADALIDAKKPTEADKVIEKLEQDETLRDRVQGLRSKLAFARASGNLTELEERVRAAPGDLAARIELAKACVAAKEHARGLEQLLEVVRADDGAQRAEAKKAMLEVFAMLGLEDKVANEYRFKLSLELFV